MSTTAGANAAILRLHACKLRTLTVDNTKVFPFSTVTVRWDVDLKGATDIVVHVGDMGSSSPAGTKEFIVTKSRWLWVSLSNAGGAKFLGKVWVEVQEGLQLEYEVHEADLDHQLDVLGAQLTEYLRQELGLSRPSASPDSSTGTVVYSGSTLQGLARDVYGSLSSIGDPTDISFKSGSVQIFPLDMLPSFRGGIMANMKFAAKVKNWPDATISVSSSFRLVARRDGTLGAMFTSRAARVLIPRWFDRDLDLDLMIINLVNEFLRGYTRAIPPNARVLAVEHMMNKAEITLVGVADS